MKLVTAEWMRQIDQTAIEQFAIPAEKLMESAGAGIAERILSDLIDSPDDTAITLFCGKGNNGGDGYVIARYLHESDCAVTIYFVGPSAKFSPETKSNFTRANKLGIDMTEIKSSSDLPDELDTDFIIDALFGTGFSGKPKGITTNIVEFINEQEAEVISVDIPSGVNADSGAFDSTAIIADYTYALALPKYGLFISPGRELSGHVETVPIGIPDEVIEKANLHHSLITAETVNELFPDRAGDGHKGTFGKLFVLAGSTGMTGAAELTAKASLRSGCGITILGTPSTVQPILATKLTEVMTRPLPDVGKKGALALRGLGEIRSALDRKICDAAIIGPGLGQHHQTFELVRRLVKTITVPVVIDADGLNALASEMDILKQLQSPAVLTPHDGEFARLSGKPVPINIRERMDTAIAFAKEYSVVLVLKGSPTVVASPDGECWLNPTGNHGMATGGSGDVLAGIIGSFLTQKMEPLSAALCGVYVHGFAGDLSADELTARAMIAGDIIDYLPNAFDWLE